MRIVKRRTNLMKQAKNLGCQLVPAAQIKVWLPRRPRLHFEIFSDRSGKVALASTPAVGAGSAETRTAVSGALPE